jgi:hypothetical protein
VNWTEEQGEYWSEDGLWCLKKDHGMWCLLRLSGGKLEHREVFQSLQDAKECTCMESSNG